MWFGSCPFPDLLWLVKTGLVIIDVSFHFIELRISVGPGARHHTPGCIRLELFIIPPMASTPAAPERASRAPSRYRNTGSCLNVSSTLNRPSNRQRSTPTPETLTVAYSSSDSQFASLLTPPLFQSVVR